MKGDLSNQPLAGYLRAWLPSLQGRCCTRLCQRFYRWITHLCLLMYSLQPKYYIYGKKLAQCRSSVLMLHHFGPFQWIWAAEDYRGVSFLSMDHTDLSLRQHRNSMVFVWDTTSDLEGGSQPTQSRSCSFYGNTSYWDKCENGLFNCGSEQSTLFCYQIHDQYAMVGSSFIQKCVYELNMNFYKDKGSQTHISLWDP